MRSHDLLVHFGKAPVDGGSSNLNEETLIYDQVRLGDGLFDGKVKLADLNNDGQLEILQIGLTNENTTSGKPKLIIHSYDNDSNSFDESDVSDQIAALSNSSFDIGDVDNDQDLDLVITGDLDRFFTASINDLIHSWLPLFCFQRLSLTKDFHPYPLSFLKLSNFNIVCTKLFYCSQ